MKNLELWHVNVRNLVTNSEDQLATFCYGHGEGNFTGELYSCSHNLIVSNFDEDGAVKWTKDLNELASPENSPVNVTYLSLSNALCVGLANGELYTISELGTSCELAGVCQAGLLAMEWSPDQELLVLVTKDMNTILMSCTFDPIHETTILDHEFGEKQFITVGWGKKETQFHGSEGKQAAKLKTEISGDVDANNAVKISWRGDGNLYAIGFLMDGIRRFKVFDREGHLQYTSEKQPGLEANLSWRPSGNVIATTQKINDNYVVAFFEKNGLKHGGFDIPVDAQTEVQDLAWSSDSEIIALQCYNKGTSSHSLLLFTTGNYHWYLKQTLTFNSYQKISKIIWDNDFEVANNKKLHLVLSNGQHYTYSWIWNINHSRGKCSNDDAVVVVIDGKKALATGFRQTVVPPPMASLEIESNSSVNSVHFAPDKKDDNDHDPNTFFVCTTDNKLQFYRQTEKFPLKYELFKTLTLEKYNFPFQYYNWFWLNTDTIICSEVDNNNSYFISEYNIKSGEITKINTESLPEPVVRIEPHPNESSAAYLQLINGDIMLYTLGGSMEPQDVSFSVACPTFNVINVSDEIHFLSLTHKGTLYLDDEKILNNVSSFFVHTHFLLLTTLQHVLLCVELTPSGLNALKVYQKNESSDVYKRKIERGAKLVIAVPNETRTVFQMPRGNLEGIQPRPLSLKIIGEYLDNCKYYEAFDLMRKQRINLNLMYDHDPEKFEKSIDIFLEAIQNNTWLSLFLSDLENADVTKSMYSSSYVDKKGEKRDSSSKIQRICETIRTHLMKRPDKDTKILPIITTYVKMNNVEALESALTVIKDLKTKETSSKLPVSSDEALKYLLYMVDVNQLFDVALGMYDFDLVLLVANKSQKDPKEYVPMLNEFNGMEENYKRFSINKLLKRFTRAVECLAKCGQDKNDELKTFVKYHSLYREALRLFTNGDAIYNEIAEDFGLHLRLQKQYTEAGIIYERANNIEKAIECYKDALEWELVVKLLCTRSKDEQSIVCWELANGLKDEKRHGEGLTLLEQFCNDKAEIVKYAIESRQFKSALRLCSMYKLSELKDDQLLPAVMEEYTNLQELIERNWGTFTKHRDRLFIVRETKRNAPEIDISYANKDSDLYSDAGSTVASSNSRSSGRTFRSSKNRRKHERKVASLKEGSQYEDVALVMALHNLITSTFELRLQARELNTALSCLNKDHEAFLLQKCLEKLLKEMKDSFKDIWTNELVIEATNAAIAALNVPEGCSVLPQGIGSLEPHMRIAPIIQDISWKLDGLN
ncbi:putative elongator complex protein 1 [Cydia splendana]|uniref:putative elongator complex protein 1 n=1 Tax=Cydia splendana TaxID=1100963 RepID=UPI0021467515